MSGLTEKLLAAFNRLHWLLQWLVLSLLALLLYAPVIGNYFVNDDFVVLRKVCLDGQLNTDGFFRPLSDISIYINYLFSELHPGPYRVASIVIHALNAMLLLHFCRQWQWAGDEGLRNLFAILSALFFLTYPFHNEAVAWLLGRASLLASTFALLSLVILSGRRRESRKMLLVALCYFLGLAAYESVLVLPGMVLIWLLANGTPARKMIWWMALMAFVLVAHFAVRILVSGSATGEYGAQLFDWDVAAAFGRAAKAAARTLAPPLSPVAFLTTAAILGLVLLTAVIMVWRKSSQQTYVRIQLLAWLSMLLVAMVIPFVFGVSTNTSESDRLLYFPSAFLCSLLAFLLLHLLYGKKWMPWVVGAVLVYNILFLEQNNQNWRHASDAVTSLLKTIKDNPLQGKIFVVNLPDQWDGAYLFRIGFKEALIVTGIDTSRVEAVNTADMREMKKLQVTDHSFTNGKLFIPPGLYVQHAGSQPPARGVNEQVLFVRDTDKIIYWNGSRWTLLQAHQVFN